MYLAYSIEIVIDFAVLVMGYLQIKLSRNLSSKYTRTEMLSVTEKHIVPCLDIIIIIIITTTIIRILKKSHFKMKIRKLLNYLSKHFIKL
jgi:hypothetical protein